jgi:hypothetical protein
MSEATTNHSRFPLLFGLVLCAVLLAGFGPSFFFRAWTTRPNLPLHLVVHGLAATAWFVVFIAQVVLAARGNRRWHRRLGIFGLGIAAAFVVTGLQSTWSFARQVAAQGHFVAANGSGEAFVYWAIAVSIGGLVVFTCLLSTALFFRRRPEVHGRLMLLATAGLMGPAVSRVVLRFAPLPNPLLAVLSVFLIMLLIRDIRVRGRPHIATVLGGAFDYLTLGAFMLSGFGKWFYTLVAG